MEVSSFGEIEAAFLERIQRMVWCNVATIDRRDRPRSRILHPLWEGNIGWITTRRNMHKAKHLAHNPYVSLAYIADVASLYRLQNCVGRGPRSKATRVEPVFNH